ncbi:MAG: SHOCT domain-containing protein [Chloroflexi bacterium]|nr:SHOCT domain-containing protein [Chloroflexota bacterium]
MSEKVSPHDSAAKILRERYARGDIDADEYERRSEVLRRDGRTA